MRRGTSTYRRPKTPGVPLGGTETEQVKGDRDLEEAERPGGRDDGLIKSRLLKDDQIFLCDRVLVLAEPVLCLENKDTPSSYCTQLQWWSVWGQD